jgi:hypothetical protein
MLRYAILFALIQISFLGFCQELKVEFDKNIDFTQYKTFRFGEGDVVTPEDQKQVDKDVLHAWIRAAVSRELELRGLQPVDSSADLVVSYVVGTMARSDAGDVGPLGMTPGSQDRAYIRDYRQSNLVIDLNDRRKIKVWRINATSNVTVNDGERTINLIVAKGFKKFSKPVKKKKK